jgi:hypothetical protein
VTGGLTAAAAVPAGIGWLLAGLVLGLLLGVLGATLVARRAAAREGLDDGGRDDADRDGGAPPTARPDGAAGPLLVDDLPGFLEHPPGSPAPAGVGAAGAVWTAGGQVSAGVLTGAPAPTDPPPSGPARPDPPDDDRTTQNAVLAMVLAAVVLIVVAIVIALADGAGSDDAAPEAGGRTTEAAGGGSGPATSARGPGAPRPGATRPGAPTASAPVPGPGAAGMALTSVPLGTDGVAASLAFGGMVLEERAVGLTVTQPSVSVSTDGERAVAHVRLPTFNCLTADPPADPLAAGCVRSVTEYADLTGPHLQVTRSGDRIELTGLFPTYTRPAGSPPALTGRAYPLAASVSPAGPVTDGRAPAVGSLWIGLVGSRSTSDPGVNVLQYPG